jgi:Guanylate kinase
VLFDIDWQGTQQLREKARADVVSVFILPPPPPTWKNGSIPAHKIQMRSYAAA